LDLDFLDLTTTLFCACEAAGGKEVGMHFGKVKGKEAKRRKKLFYVRDRADGVFQYFEKLEGEDGAKAFVEDYNAAKRRRSYNIPPNNKELKKWTVQLLVRSYLHAPEGPNLLDNFGLVLRKFANLPIAEKSLFDFTPQVAERYVEDRLKETYISNGSEVEKQYSPDTVRRDITTIQRAWEWGRKTFPRLINLENPWKGIHVPGTGFKRQRGLKKGELRKLIEHCEQCRGTNRYYVPLAIRLAVDTGMRRQEIFNLTWEDIDFEARRITIRKDKNDWRRAVGNEGRVICLPPVSQIELRELEISLNVGQLPGSLYVEFPGYSPDQEIPEAFRPPKGKIFMNTDRWPMSGNGFKQAFEEVRNRAGIVDLDPRKRLTPHSLRAAAEMIFRKAGLTDKEIDVMKNGVKGHYDVLDDFLEMIQKKLDIAFLGKPLAEALKERHEYGKDLLKIVQEVSSEGLTEEATAEKVNAKMDERYPKRAEIKAMIASLSSTQAHLAEEVS
jgi:integrase